MEMGTKKPAAVMCDICGSQEAAALPQADKYGSGGVFVCSCCGFVHVKERRTSDEIAKSWDDIYGEGYTSEWPGVHARLHYVAEWFEQCGGWEGKSVLEIGAGEGKFLEIVKGYGAHPVGLDPFDQNCIRMRSKDIFAHHGTIEQLGVVGTFDVVAILWTLENCQDCVRMLTEAKRNLASDGRLLVATGSRILVPFKKPIYRYFSRNPADTHCFRFSVNSLENAMNKTGFDAVVFNDYMQSDWLVALGAPGGRNRLLKDEPENVLAFFDAWEKHPWQ